MAYVHGTVNQISKIYLQNEKRYNYTTPKTFLEYIFLYRKLLVDKNGEFAQRISRLQSGMSKLAECACQVDTLKVSVCVYDRSGQKFQLEFNGQLTILFAKTFVLSIKFECKY